MTVQPWNVRCPTCEAQVGHSCRTKSGKRASDHAAREKLAQATSTPDVAPKATANPCRDRSDDEHKPAPYDDLDDARRVLRNRTYGIVDPTLDPIDVLAELVSGLDAMYTVEQWEEREKEYNAKLVEYGELHAAAEGRASAAECERDELRLSIVTARDQIKLLEVEIDQLRSNAQLLNGDEP